MGAVQARYDFDPFGRVTKISETVPSDFGFGSYYLHSRSGLNLTETRVYNAILGRFLNRDILMEAGGSNLFAYASDNPTGEVDPAGTNPLAAAIFLTPEGAAALLGALAAAGLLANNTNQMITDTPNLHIEFPGGSAVFSGEFTIYPNNPKNRDQCEAACLSIAVALRVFGVPQELVDPAYFACRCYCRNRFPGPPDPGTPMRRRNDPPPTIPIRKAA